jgi:hypothetical protein
MQRPNNHLIAQIHAAAARSCVLLALREASNGLHSACAGE